jgi:hypothetical protein
MVANPGSSGSSSSTFVTTRNTTVATVVPTVITQSDQIALYFSEDLEELVRVAGINLAEAFQIPMDYSHDPRDIITLLYEDIAHMLRDGLITGIHLILSDNQTDKGTNAYLVRYHVQYQVHPLQSSFATSIPFPSQRQGGLVAPPAKVWRDARFALLIDWSDQVKDRRHEIRRPNYCFDWIAEEESFDAGNVVCYRHGQMVVDSATLSPVDALVSRRESTSLEHHRDLY